MLITRAFFLVYRSQPVTPVKHGYTHFATLSAIDEFLRSKIFAFPLVYYVKKEKKGGGSCGSRTHDLGIKSPLLYQLS